MDGQALITCISMSVHVWACVSMCTYARVHGYVYTWLHDGVTHAPAPPCQANLLAEVNDPGVAAAEPHFVGGEVLAGVPYLDPEDGGDEEERHPIVRQQEERHEGVVVGEEEVGDVAEGGEAGRFPPGGCGAGGATLATKTKSIL